MGDEVLSETNQLIKDCFSGKSGRDIDQGDFKDKTIIDRKEAEKRLGLLDGKKNIVIMAHTFTDAIYNYGTICYRDYYDWIESTLKIAEEVEQVNWILKPHPTRKAYHESKDSIEPSNKEEYEQILRSSDKIIKLDENQIKTAKKYFILETRNQELPNFSAMNYTNYLESRKYVCQMNTLCRFLKGTRDRLA